MVRIIIWSMLFMVRLMLYPAEFGELILHYPSKAWPLFQQVCTCVNML